jgi:hypothetical protein
MRRLIFVFDLVGRTLLDFFLGYLKHWLLNVIDKLTAHLTKWASKIEGTCLLTDLWDPVKYCQSEANFTIIGFGKANFILGLIDQTRLILISPKFEV